MADAHIGPALGEHDYAQLLTLSTSSDDAERAQAATLAKKLTAGEQQEFFDYQQRVNSGKGERTRDDNSVGGLPPELAVTSGLSVGRAVAGAVPGAVSRTVAGAKAVAAQAAPAVKYEATKTLLERAGVPTPIAVATAIAVSGHQKGAKAPRPKVKAVLSDLDLAKQEAAAGRLPQSVVDGMTRAAAKKAAQAASGAAPSVPATAPVVPDPVVAQAPASPVAAATSAKVSPKLLNEVAMLGRRTGQAPLNVAEQLRAADLVVKGGQSAEQAVAGVVAARAASPAEALARTLGTPDDAAVAAHFQQLYERGQKTAPHK